MSRRGEERIRLERRKMNSMRAVSSQLHCHWLVRIPRVSCSRHMSALHRYAVAPNHHHCHPRRPCTRPNPLKSSDQLVLDIGEASAAVSRLGRVPITRVAGRTKYGPERSGVRFVCHPFSPVPLRPLSIRRVTAIAIRSRGGLAAAGAAGSQAKAPMALERPLPKKKQPPGNCRPTGQAKTGDTDHVTLLSSSDRPNRQHKRQ